MREERKIWVVWSLGAGWQIVSKTSPVLMKHFNHCMVLCSRFVGINFKFFKNFHIASFDSWVFCTLNNYLGALIIFLRSDTPTCDRYNACIRGPSGGWWWWWGVVVVGGWLPPLKGG